MQKMKWDTTLYDKKHNFVSNYGKELLSYIPKNKEQKILDLGCGTGILTTQLAKMCSYVLGADSSQEMIKKAAKQHKEIDFIVCDALNLPFEKEWDIVFSNAVFHWIKDHNILLQNIYKALKPKGMLICEFGAYKNIANIENTFAKVLKELGYIYYSKFNFPKIENFNKLLIANNFHIDHIYDYDRPTPLKDGEKGLSNWIKQFFASDLVFFSKREQDIICNKVEKVLKPIQWNGVEWIADYKRLRVIAHT